MASSVGLQGNVPPRRGPCSVSLGLGGSSQERWGATGRNSLLIECRFGLFGWLHLTLWWSVLDGHTHPVTSGTHDGLLKFSEDTEGVWVCVCVCRYSFNTCASKVPSGKLIIAGMCGEFLVRTGETRCLATDTFIGKYKWLYGNKYNDSKESGTKITFGYRHIASDSHDCVDVRGRGLCKHALDGAKKKLNWRVCR